MNKLIPILFFLIFISCNEKTKNSTPITHDLGAFKITTGPYWKPFKIQSIDSYVGGLTNGQDTLIFDFGWYSPEIGDLPSDGEHLYATDTINGLPAVMQIPKAEGNGRICMDISGLKNKNRFFIGGYRLSNTKEIINIFKSIVFPESDTSINGQLTLKEFSANAMISGKKIFTTYCSSCHSRYHRLSGPALSEELLTHRNEKWLYKFFTDKSSLPNDSILTLHKNEFRDIKCVSLKGVLSDAEIHRIIRYIKSF